MERNEVDMAVHIQGEALSLKRKGVPVDVWEWDSHPILTQTKTISRYSDPMQKRLAFALLNRTLNPSFLEAFGDEFLWRPTNREAGITEYLAANGTRNSADAASNFTRLGFLFANKMEITDKPTKYLVSETLHSKFVITLGPSLKERFWQRFRPPLLSNDPIHVICNH